MENDDVSQLPDVSNVSQQLQQKQIRADYVDTEMIVESISSGENAEDNLFHGIEKLDGNGGVKDDYEKWLTSMKDWQQESSLQPCEYEEGNKLLTRSTVDFGKQSKNSSLFYFDLKSLP